MRLILLGAPLALAAVLHIIVPPYMKPATRLLADGVGPTQMKAAVYSEYGSADQVLRVVSDRQVPHIAPHEVLVKVAAAALNPIDYKKMAGAMFLVEAITRELQGGSIPGFDLAGHVVAVGSECSRIKVGDKVFAMAFILQTGALAEFTAVPESLVSLKPDQLSFAEAASVPLAGITSLQALRDFGGLRSGESVVVLGGSGGTGTFALQIAKALGAGHVTTTSSRNNSDLVFSLGADDVVNYRTEDWADKLGVGKAGLVYDCVGGLAEWQRALRVLPPSPAGRYVTIAGDLQAAFSIPYLLARGLEIGTRKLKALFRKGPAYDFIATVTNHEDLDVLAGFISEGLLHPVVDRTFSLNEVVDAFKYLSAGHARGKVVVTIESDA